MTVAPLVEKGLTESWLETQRSAFLITFLSFIADIRLPSFFFVFQRVSSFILTFTVITVSAAAPMEQAGVLLTGGGGPAPSPPGLFPNSLMQTSDKPEEASKEKRCNVTSSSSAHSCATCLKIPLKFYFFVCFRLAWFSWEGIKKPTQRHQISPCCFVFIPKHCSQAAMLESMLQLKKWRGGKKRKNAKNTLSTYWVNLQKQGRWSSHTSG